MKGNYMIYRLVDNEGREETLFYLPEKDADEILRENNINPDEIQYIIISHFHPDHYGSLKKFPKAVIICSREAAELLASCKSSKIRNLVFEKLIFKDMEKRIIKMDE